MTVSLATGRTLQRGRIVASAIGVFLLSLAPVMAGADVINDPITGEQMAASCEYHDVRVSMDTTWQDRVTINAVPGEPAGYDGIERFHGPDGVSYLKLRQPDTMVAPGDEGWRASLFVAGTDAEPFEMQVSQILSMRAYWTDVSQLEVVVFWGRIVATVFTVDTQTMTITSAEGRNYFESILPCRQ